MASQCCPVTIDPGSLKTCSLRSTGWQKICIRSLLYKQTSTKCHPYFLKSQGLHSRNCDGCLGPIHHAWGRYFLKAPKHEMCENTLFHKFSSLQAEKKTRWKKQNSAFFSSFPNLQTWRLDRFYNKKKQGLQHFLLAKKTPCFGPWVNVPWVFWKNFGAPPFEGNTGSSNLQEFRDLEIMLNLFPPTNQPLTPIIIKHERSKFEQSKVSRQRWFNYKTPVARLSSPKPNCGTSVKHVLKKNYQTSNLLTVLQPAFEVCCQAFLDYISSDRSMATLHQTLIRAWSWLKSFWQQTILAYLKVLDPSFHFRQNSLIALQTPKKEPFTSGKKQTPTTSPRCFVRTSQVHPDQLMFPRMIQFHPRFHKWFGSERCLKQSNCNWKEKCTLYVFF